MHRRLFWLRLRQFVIPIMATVLIVAGIFLYQNHLKKSRQAKLGMSDSFYDELSIANLDTKEFESLLARSSSDQLTRLALDLADEPGQQLVVRLDRMEKRIAILDQILELAPNGQNRNFAISSKFETLMDREFVAVVNDLDDNVSPTQLRDFAGKHSQSDNVSVANAVAAATAVAAISEFLSTDSSQRRSELAKTALDEFLMASSRTSDDLSVAKRFENWLKLIHSDSDSSQSQDFVDAFVKGYGGSSNDAIAGLAVRIRKSLGDSELELVGLLDSTPANRRDTIRQLMVQVEAALEQGDLSESMQLHLMSRANDLLRFGNKTEAREIREKLAGLPQKNATDELNRELAKFDQRMKLFESSFDVSCFADLDSNPAQFTTADAEYKILFFGSAANSNQPLVEFNQLLKALRNERAGSKLEIAVIYLDRGTDSTTLDVVRKFAAQKGRWQVWFLTTTSSAGQEFLARTPIDETPYVVVLGKNDRVVALDPSVIGVKEIVSAE